MTTFRFILLWGLVSAAAIFLKQLAIEPIIRLAVGMSLTFFWISMYSIEALFVFPVTLVQERLLRAIGRPVRRWTLRMMAGWGVLAGLHFGSMFFTFAAWVRLQGAWGEWPALAYRLAIATSNATALAVIIGCVVWGRRWPSTWPLWLFGRILLAVPPALLAHVVRHAPPGSPLASPFLPESTAWQVAEAFYLGLGTAWLLWRVVLPSPDGGVVKPLGAV